MNVYFNAEYTGTNKDASLISLGCIAETGQRLYIEFLDVPSYLVSSYVRSDIFPDTYLYDRSETIHTADEGLEAGKAAAEKYGYQYWVTCKGHTASILLAWFKALIGDSDDHIQLVSYCCDYDACLFFNLFNGEIPTFILNPVCYDIFEDVMRYAGFFDKSVSLAERVQRTLACNLPDVLTNQMSLTFPEYDKNHALSYAELIKLVYEKLAENN